MVPGGYIEGTRFKVIGVTEVNFPHNKAVHGGYFSVLFPRLVRNVSSCCLLSGCLSRCRWFRIKALSFLRVRVTLRPLHHFTPLFLRWLLCVWLFSAGQAFFTPPKRAFLFLPSTLFCCVDLDNIQANVQHVLEVQGF